MQDSGPIEIIPLICTLTTQGQYPECLSGGRGRVCFLQKQLRNVCQAFISYVADLQPRFCPLKTMYIHQWNRDRANLLVLWISGY